MTAPTCGSDTSSRGAGRVPGWAVVLLVDLSLSWHLHPLRAVVEGRRQLHGNRRTDVTVPSPEPAIPPPLGGSSAVAHGTTARVPQQKCGTKVALSGTPCGGCGGCGADLSVNVASLSIAHHSMHLIMEVMSLWT